MWGRACSVGWYNTVGECKGPIELPWAIHKMTAVGFEPMQLALVELESTPLDHSGKLSMATWFGRHANTVLNVSVRHGGLLVLIGHIWGCEKRHVFQTG